MLAGAGGKGEEEALLREARSLAAAREGSGPQRPAAKKGRKGNKAAESPPPAGRADPEGVPCSPTSQTHG